MYEGPVQDVIDEFGRLPGIGPKSAQRIAFHLLSVDRADIDRLCAALTRMAVEVKSMFALVTYVEPKKGEITIRIPADKINPQQ